MHGMKTRECAHTHIRRRYGSKSLTPRRVSDLIVPHATALEDFWKLKRPISFMLVAFASPQPKLGTSSGNLPAGDRIYPPKTLPSPSVWQGAVVVRTSYDFVVRKTTLWVFFHAQHISGCTFAFFLKEDHVDSCLTMLGDTQLVQAHTVRACKPGAKEDPLFEQIFSAQPMVTIHEACRLLCSANNATKNPRNLSMSSRAMHLHATCCASSVTTSEKTWIV